MYMLIPEDVVPGDTTIARTFKDLSTAIQGRKALKKVGVDVVLHKVHEINDMGAPKKYAGV